MGPCFAKTRHGQPAMQGARGRSAQRGAVLQRRALEIYLSAPVPCGRNGAFGGSVHAVRCLAHLAPRTHAAPRGHTQNFTYAVRDAVPGGAEPDEVVAPPCVNLRDVGAVCSSLRKGAVYRGSQVLRCGLLNPALGSAHVTFFFSHSTLCLH